MHTAQLHARNTPRLMAEQRDDLPAAVHDVQNQHGVILLDAVADNVIVYGAPHGRNVADRYNCPASTLLGYGVLGDYSCEVAVTST